MITTIILVFHLIIAATMVGLILMQRAEGGALGIGGGSGGMMAGRQPGNPLTRMTAILAALFMVSSLALALLSKRDANHLSPVLDTGPFVPPPAATGPAVPGQSGAPSVPVVPTGDQDADSWTPEASDKKASPEASGAKTPSPDTPPQTPASGG